MKDKRRSWWLALLPLLVFYLVVWVVCADNSLSNDQGRYFNYARNLSQGYYAPLDSLMLWNGPGYPLVLVPFVMADIPVMWAKLLNPLFLFGAVCFTYCVLRQYMSAGRSLLGSYALGLYVPFLPYMPLLLTECLAVFLAAGFCHFLVKYFRSGRTRYMWVAAAFLAYLMLTKVIFAYVVGLGLLVALILAKWRVGGRRSAAMCAISLVFCLPYLIYTYNLTGKMFYWGNAGGTTLYWMTTPYAEEYGDWVPSQRILKDERLHRHRELYEEIAGLNYVDKDARLKKEAVLNLRRYPMKYCANWVSNLGRMWFEYPISYKLQRPHTLFFMLANSFLLVFLVACVYPLWKWRRALPGELVVLILFAVFFLGGSSLVSTYTRLIQPVLPVFIIVIFYTLNVVLEIKFRSDDTLNK